MSFTSTYERIFPRIGAFVKRAGFWIDTAAILRPNGVVVLGAAVAAVAFMPEKGSEVSSFFDPRGFYPLAAALLASVAMLYAGLIFIPYAWFLLTYYMLRKDRNQILFTFPRESCVRGETFDVDAILQRKLRLLAGAIRFRLVFWNYDTTDWYLLSSNQFRKGRPFASTDKGALGGFSLRFRHLGRYRTRYSVVRFEDPLGLFSLPIVEREHHPTDRHRNFYVYSVPARPDAASAPPWIKRRNVPSASEQRFKVAEDFFDTKRYEPSDDSRRILWPVYSRARSLLVRIPERDSVVDSDLDVHILFYNSFLHTPGISFAEAYDAWICSVAVFLDSLLRQRAVTIRLFTDVRSDPPYENDPMLPAEENLRRKLVSTHWHRDTTPSDYLFRFSEIRHSDREAVLLVNPFVSADELPEEFLPAFSAAYLLSADAPSKPSDRLKLLTRSERAYFIRRVSDRIFKSRFRRLHENRMRLAARLKEIS